MRKLRVHKWDRPSLWPGQVWWQLYVVQTFSMTRPTLVPVMHRTDLLHDQANFGAGYASYRPSPRPCLLRCRLYVVLTFSTTRPTSVPVMHRTDLHDQANRPSPRPGQLRWQLYVVQTFSTTRPTSVPVMRHTDLHDQANRPSPWPGQLRCRLCVVQTFSMTRTTLVPVMRRTDLLHDQANRPSPWPGQLRWQLYIVQVMEKSVQCITATEVSLVMEKVCLAFGVKEFVKTETLLSIVLSRHLDKAIWRPNWSSTISGFAFVDIAAFRRSKSMSKPNFVDISQLMAEI